MNVRLVLAGAVIAGVGGIYACGGSEAPLAPRRAVEPALLTASTVAPSVVATPSTGHVLRVLSWSDRLSHDVVGAARVGASGGTIVLPTLGASFFVPSGALSAPTTITVRALAGRRLAFRMEPSGLQFAKPALFTVSLRNSTVFRQLDRRGSLLGAYIVSPAGLDANDLVSAYEEMTAYVDPSVSLASVPVRHFSVVILASQVDDAGGRPRAQ